MKKLVAVLVLSLAAASAQALDHEDCKVVSNVAFSAANAKHVGLPMGLAASTTNGDQLLQSIVLNAYLLPDFKTEKYKIESTQEFALKYYMSCRVADDFDEI